MLNSSQSSVYWDTALVEAMVVLGYTLRLKDIDKAPESSEETPRNTFEIFSVIENL